MEINKFKNLTISLAHESLKNGIFSSLGLTQYYLGQIDALDKSIQAFVTICSETAIEQAKIADEIIQKAIISGNDFPILTGLPFAMKDSFCTEGIKTTASSKMLSDFIPPYSSTAYLKLRSQNAVLLGKTNLDAWGHGSSTENSDFFVTKNPHDLTRVAGGSSGGSAAAVAADMCLFAIAEDTGGSIRGPVSFCGVFGLKPTYGRISRYGCIALASSLDTVGPMSKCAKDSSIIFNILKGADGKDQTIYDKSSKLDKISLLETSKSLNGISIGLPKEYFVKGLSKQVSDVIYETKEKLISLGAKVIDISLPHTKYGASVYYVIQTAEASSNLNRYDGIRFGYSNMSEKSWDLKVEKSREESLGDEAKRRILLGTFVLSSGYFDAYYIKAQKVRNLIRLDYLNAFKNVDAILSPITPSVAFKIGENTSDPLQMYLEDIFTIPINLAGITSFAFPMGTNIDGLPIGMQLIGEDFADEFMMKITEVLKDN